MQLDLDRDGAQLFPDLVAGELLDGLKAILSAWTPVAGARIASDPELSDWISNRSPVGEVARSLRGLERNPSAQYYSTRAKARTGRSAGTRTARSPSASASTCPSSTIG